MHAQVIEIAWHEGAPVWSVDSVGDRVVTAGGDKVARVWRKGVDVHAVLKESARFSDPARKERKPPHVVEWLCDLRAHTTTVNVARFSKDGLCIATAADQGEIVLWRIDGSGVSPEESPLDAADHPAPKERWVRMHTLRGHVQDVLDLSWSTDGTRLASASIDNSVMIWDALYPTRTPCALRDHANFVQGVSFDPFGRFVASLGNDRCMRVFTQQDARSGWSQNVAVSHALGSENRLFADDSKFKNFFRRLSWSPDGSFLACPSGMYTSPDGKKYAVHLFARHSWCRPAAQCGGFSKPAGVVRFSPVFYKLRKASSSQARLSNAEDRSAADVRCSDALSERSLFSTFSYRMIFAVACIDAIFVYDTETCQRPIARIEGIHCAEHTDLAWSSDGQTLMVSSVDGYISIVSFAEGELGIPILQSDLPTWLRHQEPSVIGTQESDSFGLHVSAKVIELVTPVKSRGTEDSAVAPEVVTKSFDKPEAIRGKTSDANCATGSSGESTGESSETPPLSGIENSDSPAIGKDPKKNCNVATPTGPVVTVVVPRRKNRASPERLLSKRKVPCAVVDETDDMRRPVAKRLLSRENQTSSIIDLS